MKFNVKEQKFLFNSSCSALMVPRLIRVLSGIKRKDTLLSAVLLFTEGTFVFAVLHMHTSHLVKATISCYFPQHKPIWI